MNVSYKGYKKELLSSTKKRYGGKNGSMFASGDINKGGHNERPIPKRRMPRDA
ncbi:hypothetical protein VroAM7_32090 [Vibrio rotiferianus]|jgi:hypothetical protein|uniref:Uncharacterized protein n=1 Tax=Vibrio rotiferianus TaxID=190895 RepID=A0A510IDS8_9VIBR|nr:hypothetical protein VroAM7_32090 [Vibrio rotiferianus]